jgi:hypothetical protein
MKFTVSTKPSADKAAVSTVVEINFEGASQDVRDALAVQALIVKAQSGWRKHGIPATATLNVKDYAPGVRHTQAPVNVFDAAKLLTPEEKARLIEMLK